MIHIIALMSSCFTIYYTILFTIPLEYFTISNTTFILLVVFYLNLLISNSSELLAMKICMNHFEFAILSGIIGLFKSYLALKQLK